MLKNNTVQNKTEKKEVPVCVLANPTNVTSKKVREVICEDWVSKQDEEGITAFYEALVPRKEVALMQLKAIHEIFPTFDDIDVHMILKGFKNFEETIGEQNFAKVKRYFGIGCKANKKMNSKEIEDLISRLRTIENAQYYICGYKELISKLASLLEGDEEYKYTALEKAKIVRMHAVLFLGRFDFAEDFSYYGTGKDKTIKINYDLLESNNKRGFYPEELFILYLSKFSKAPKKSIFFDSILFELSELKDNRILNKVLEFSELSIRNGKFVSVNKANPYQTFGKVRNIKQEIYYEPLECPNEFFSTKHLAEKIDWGTLYTMYRILKTYQLDELKKVERTYIKFEGSRLVNTKWPYYEVTPNNYIGGELEKERYIWIVELFATKGLSMYLRYDLKTFKKLRKPKKYNIGQFISAIKFANEAELVRGPTTIERDFEIAEKLTEMDKKCILPRYAFNEFSIEEVKSMLQIDETLEFEFFGIKPKIEHKDVIAKFALENGYIESEDEINEEDNQNLIQELIISGNEELIERYSSGEIDEEKFKKKLGISEEFAEMFFNLSKVDIASIEEKLLEVKKSTVGKKKFGNDLKLLGLLYCNIMERQIACGPKKRVPKGNKALKPSNLRRVFNI